MTDNLKERRGWGGAHHWNSKSCTTPPSVKKGSCAQNDSLTKMTVFPMLSSLSSIKKPSGLLELVLPERGEEFTAVFWWSERWRSHHEWKLDRNCTVNVRKRLCNNRLVWRRGREFLDWNEIGWLPWPNEGTADHSLTGQRILRCGQPKAPLSSLKQTTGPQQSFQPNSVLSTSTSRRKSDFPEICKVQCSAVQQL